MNTSVKFQASALCSSREKCYENLALVTMGEILSFSLNYMEVGTRTGIQIALDSIVLWYGSKFQASALCSS